MVNLNPTTSVILLIAYGLNRDCQNEFKNKTQLLAVRLKYTEAKKHKRTSLNHTTKTK